MRRHFLQIILAACAVFAMTIVTSARYVYFPSYAEMSSKADLIVLATPIQQQTLPDKVDVPGVRRGNDPIPAIKVETKFEIQAVLHGDPEDQKSLTLLHYREAKPLPKGQPQGNPLDLVDFKAKSGKVYLMFLRRDADGRYSAFNGQTDPAHSIKEVIAARP
jgi:hypothetical protein